MPSVKETLQKISTLPRQNRDIDKNTETSFVSEPDIKSNEGVVAVNAEQLNEFFAVYIEDQKNDHPRLYSALKGQTLVETAKQKFELIFQNQALLDEYKMRIKPGLTAYLRQKPNFGNIELEEQIADMEKLGKPKLFNDQEKLKVMAEKNPAILQLKLKFNLDFD